MIPPFRFKATATSIRRYARATGLRYPFHHDRACARAHGFRDIVAPAMYVAVYAMPPVLRALQEPAWGIDVARNVHGSQAFTWGEPVCAGDVLTTHTCLANQYEKAGHGFYVFETVSLNQAGQETARGAWTMIVRGGGR